MLFHTHIKQKSRSNANRVDLNRNFPTTSWISNPEEPRYIRGESPLSEPENRFLVRRFRQYPPGFILTFHSWKPMLNSNGECEEIPQWLSSRNRYPVVRETIDDHPTPGSLGTYASTRYRCPVLTFECPTITQRLTMETIWQENEEALKSLIASEIFKKYL